MIFADKSSDVKKRCLSNKAATQKVQETVDINAVKNNQGVMLT
jgi:hypothetical protein